MDEFALINRWFTGIGPCLPEVVEGVGDDCALLQLRPDEQLALSVDTSVADRHFPRQADPWALGWRALAVALSDLAAMGARPLGFTLAITLPKVDEDWLEGFSQGLRAMAEQAQCPLLGGDTTRGPLSVTVQVHGAVKAEKAWRRSGAKPGDVLALLGEVGLARAGLVLLRQSPERAQNRQDWTPLEQAYLLPQPMLEASRCLVQGGCRIAAAIDVSDGLLVDLQHLLAASAVGAELNLEQLRLAPTLLAELGAAKALEAALYGGDDYALLLALPETDFQRAGQLCPSLCRIGHCVPGAGMRTSRGQLLEARGYNHFPAQPE